jgi:hypothetical protein
MHRSIQQPCSVVLHLLESVFERVAERHEPVFLKIDLEIRM